MRYYLDTGRGVITLGWVTRVRVSDYQRPETPHDSGLITDDMFKYHREVYYSSVLANFILSHISNTSDVYKIENQYDTYKSLDKFPVHNF